MILTNLIPIGYLHAITGEMPLEAYQNTENKVSLTLSGTYRVTQQAKTLSLYSPNETDPTITDILKVSGVMFNIFGDGCEPCANYFQETLEIVDG